MNVLRTLSKQGPYGMALVTALTLVYGLGVATIAVGYVCLAWSAVVVHTFGGPPLDFFGGFGVCMVVSPIVGLVLLVTSKEK